MTLPVETEQRDDETGVKRKKHTGRTVIVVLTTIVLIAAVLSGSYIANLAGSFNSKTEKIESAFPEESTRPQKSEVTSGPPAKNILLMGSDSRGAAPDSQTAAPSDQRSDVLMLVHIPSDRKNVYSISLMRDLWVSIPGHGEAKINAALALGGVPLVVQTVESILNQRIDHVASLDFEGFKGLTESLGGVEVNSNVAFSTGPFSYVAGTNTLSGDKALAFVRERYAFPDGDYQRVRNQQAFVKGVLAKTINADTLSNPVTVSNLVNVFSPFVAVDKSLDAAALGSLAVELKDVRPQNMTMFTLPTGGIGTSVDGQSIVFSDKTAVQEISKALTEDKLSAYIAAKNLQNGN